MDADLQTKEAPCGRQIDLAAVRRDTPGLPGMLHFDNAGASPTPQPVHERMIAHLERERRIGGYAAAREAEAELGGFYQSVARLIGAAADEIAFAENATRAWDMFFYGISFKPGDRILTCRAEYASNYLAFLQAERRYGIRIECVPDGEDGAIDIQALADRLDENVRLVSLCHIPTSNGLVNDAEAVGRVLKGHPALYMLDACQSVGQMAIDVKRIGCDMLSGTGRKFLRGARGTGFLYVRREALEKVEPPFVDMRAAEWTSIGSYRLRRDARRFESWESPVASRLGLKAAADYAFDLGLDVIEARVTDLAERLRDALRGIPGVTVRDRGSRRSGLVSFSVDGLDAVAVRNALSAQGAAVSVLILPEARLDLGPDACPAIVRASVHYFNIEEEVDRFAGMLETIAASGA